MACGFTYDGTVTTPPRLDLLPAYDSRGRLNVVVESPRGSSSKYKFDAELGTMVFSRRLPAGTAYPHDFGFVPSTYAEDGDPLDVMVLWDGVTHPGIVIPCRVLGVLRVEQTNKTLGRRERNDRVAAVPARLPDLLEITSIFDLPARARDELVRFFVNAVAFEGKDLEILGWSGPTAAGRIVKRAMTAARRTGGT